MIKVEFPGGFFRMHLKKFFSAAALLGCLTMIFTGCSQKSSGLTPVTLSEVAHSIFYAPMYVAIENGYFADEGLDITLVNGSGADNACLPIPTL